MLNQVSHCGIGPLVLLLVLLLLFIIIIIIVLLSLIKLKIKIALNALLQRHRNEIPKLSMYICMKIHLKT